MCVRNRAAEGLIPKNSTSVSKRPGAKCQNVSFHALAESFSAGAGLHHFMPGLLVTEHALMLPVMNGIINTFGIFFFKLSVCTSRIQ